MRDDVGSIRVDELLEHCHFALLDEIADNVEHERNAERTAWVVDQPLQWRLLVVLLSTKTVRRVGATAVHAATYIVGGGEVGCRMRQQDTNALDLLKEDCPVQRCLAVL